MTPQEDKEDKEEIETLIDALEIIREDTEGIAGILRTINEKRPDEISQEDEKKIERWISSPKEVADNPRKVAKLMIWYIATRRLGIKIGKIATVSFTNSESETTPPQKDKKETQTLIKALKIIREDTEDIAGILRTINENQPKQISPVNEKKIEQWISSPEEIARLMIWYIATHCLKIKTGKIATVSFNDSTSLMYF